jgi:hypothetical protein
MIKDEMGFPTETIELDSPTDFCPFCGANIEWASRGGFDADEYDENRLDT